MLTRRERWILSMKTIVHFKCNIEMDLEFYVRVRTCEKRVTGKQPLGYVQEKALEQGWPCVSENCT